MVRRAEGDSMRDGDERDPVGVVLAEVRDVGPVSAAQIVEGTGLSESTVRRALSTLEEGQLVESESYRRRGRVWLPAGEDEDSNPTGEACAATARLTGPCDRGLGHPGVHHDAAGNEWPNGGEC
jgi:DNA-binding transcriptional ArsR family regulator